MKVLMQIWAILLVALTTIMVACSPIHSYNMRPSHLVRQDVITVDDFPARGYKSNYQRCGIAAIDAAIVLAGGRTDTTACRVLTTKERAGTSPIELIHIANMSGCTTRLLDGTIASIKESVSNDCPVVVCIATESGKSHYTVVIGVQEDEARLYLLEPLEGMRYTVKAELFIEAWEKAKKFSLSVQ